MSEYPRGSEWRKWDLHVHTASSYDADYQGSDSDELLINALRSNNIAAVAITDHFLIDGNRIAHLRELAPEITFFPGVELRTDKGASNLHIILIFSECIDLPKLENDFNVIMHGEKSKSKTNNHTIYWTFEDIIDFAHSRNALVSIHAGKKTSGIDKEITNATPFKEAIKEDIAREIHFFEIGKISDIDDYNTYVFKSIQEKPLILCSDNHDPRNYCTKEILWIKSDPTFEGLIQCIYQPKERIYIGNLPPKLDKVNKSKRTYIDSLSVRKNDDAKNVLDSWFDFTMPMNSGLTAVIGNRGSGKSALSDIVGHLCKSKSMSEASFLNSERFLKTPKNLANDYSGSISWLDGKTDGYVTLGIFNSDTSIENAQFLPQKYIEKICNDLGEEFQAEVNKVIFSYIDVTEKGDSKNLRELIENKSETINAEIEAIQKDLDDINKVIMHAEDCLTSNYLKTLEENLKKREEDYDRHIATKPPEVKILQTNTSVEYQQALKEIDTQICSIESSIAANKSILTDTNMKMDKLEKIAADINIVVGKISSLNLTLIEVAQDLGIDKETFEIRYNTPLDKIEIKLAELENNKSEMQETLDNSEEANSEISFPKKLEHAVNRKQELVSSTNAEEKLYQKYLDDIKEWESIGQNMIGNKRQEGSIEYLKAEIQSAKTDYPALYESKKSERLSKVREIFEKKQKVARVYFSIYQPVEKELRKVLGEIDDRIEFTADLIVADRSISSRLLEYVNQTFKGVFNGKTESQNRLNMLIKKMDMSNPEDICIFTNEVFECIYEDIDNSSKKVKNKEDFYKLLTHLDYIGIEYSLKMGGRSLLELSPGERGIVLLVFYLALSKNEIPLIIDQPEDNLDNQSVYKKLVHCICEAKKKRQVIIVTHNPNIAIACDAEQIVYCEINKTNNRISYTSGSIENQYIRRKVIDVLEGTMPAFHLRRLKYTSSF